ncbi:hypothetical protein [Nisaea nitritireducens]|nr:hypothetical protein [Nisaea nitritireducens]
MSEEQKPNTREELYARKRGKNLAILACIVVAALLFYAITILRMGS